MPKKTGAVKVSDNNKAWNRKKKSEKPYNVESISKKKTFLIVCEGENTEPQYFKSFPVVTATIETIGLGASKTYLVESAKTLSKESKYKDFEVWCVFDLDIKPDNLSLKEDFNAAINMANANGFKVAYSNDAFELWFVLHYQAIEAQLTRHEYYEILSRYLGANYEKEGKKFAFCKTIYKCMQTPPASQANAIVRAEKLHQSYQKEIPSNQNPCTTVYQLVRELNACI